MPAWNVNIDEGAATSLSGFAPSFGESLKASVANTFNENVSTLGYDYLANQNANSGQKLDKPEAERMVKEAGAKLTIPDEGYTKDALSQLIKRQQDQMTRQSVMDRTPWSWLGSPTRGAAMLLTGLTDPLNVASAFIPVVGEVRAASVLARTTGVARFGARAAIGAAEGAVGAAVLEPAVYGLHQGLQDDYHMVDSLMNIGFGGLLGGGLHSVGGTVADALRVGPDAYARFAGLDQEQVGRVLEFERLTRRGEKPNSDAWTPGMRQAAGLEPPPAAHLADSMTPEGREATLRTAVADMVQGRAPDVEAVVRFDREANLKAWLGNSVARDQTGAPVVMYHGTAQDVREFKPKQAEAIFLADHPIVGEAYSNSSVKWMQENGQEGAQNILPLYVKAERPFDYENQNHINAVIDRAFQLNPTHIQGDGQIALVMDGKNSLYTRGVLEHALKEGEWNLIESPEIQRAVKDLGHDSFYVHETGFKNLGVYDASQVKSAIGNSGLFDPNSRSLTDAVDAAERQQKPEAVMLGSPEASKAAEARVAEAPKEHAVEAAKVELTDAMSRLSELQKNLELGGAAPEKLARITEGLKAFDEAIKDAANIGKAIIQNAICGLRS